MCNNGHKFCLQRHDKGTFNLKNGAKKKKKKNCCHILAKRDTNVANFAKKLLSFHLSVWIRGLS